jgi:hypothetical protein
MRLWHVELEDKCARRLCHDTAEGHDLLRTRLAQAVVSDMIVWCDEALHSRLEPGEVFRV